MTRASFAHESLSRCDGAWLRPPRTLRRVLLDHGSRSQGHGRAEGRGHGRADRPAGRTKTAVAATATLCVLTLLTGCGNSAEDTTAEPTASRSRRCTSRSGSSRRPSAPSRRGSRSHRRRDRHGHYRTTTSTRRDYLSSASPVVASDRLNAQPHRGDAGPQSQPPARGLSTDRRERLITRWLRGRSVCDSGWASSSLRRVRTPRRTPEPLPGATFNFAPPSHGGNTGSRE